MNITIIKAGETFAELREQAGDFEHWIAEKAGLTGAQFITRDIRQLIKLPDPTACEAVIITGSHAMVTDNSPWSERLVEWISEAVRLSVPLLGICYGHQILARAVGGEVADNPKGREFGTVLVQLSEKAQKDDLFRGLAQTLSVHTAHTQSVCSLPSRAVVLARNDHDRFHAFRVGRCAWGVQFHPEFDARITRYYVKRFSKELREEGKDCEKLLKNITEQPTGEKLLKRFVAFAANLSSGADRESA